MFKLPGFLNLLNCFVSVINNITATYRIILDILGLTDIIDANFLKTYLERHREMKFISLNHFSFLSKIEIKLTPKKNIKHEFVSINCFGYDAIILDLPL